MLALILLLPPVTVSMDKYGKQIILSTTTGSFKGWKELNKYHTSEFSDVQDIGYRYLRSIDTNETEREMIGNYSEFMEFLESRQKFNELLDSGEYINDQRRLIEELLDNSFYETNVHPRKDYRQPTRVNLSMSLYQVLDVVSRTEK